MKKIFRSGSTARCEGARVGDEGRPMTKSGDKGRAAEREGRRESETGGEAQMEGGNQKEDVTATGG